MFYDLGIDVDALDDLSIDDRRKMLMKCADDMCAAAQYTTSQGYVDFLESRAKFLDIVNSLAQRSHKNEAFIHSVERAFKFRNFDKIDFTNNQI